MKRGDTAQGGAFRPRALAVVATAITAVAALTACAAGGGGGTSASGSGGAKNLTVLVEGGGHGELQPIADKFQQQTGTKVTFVELPYDGLYDRLNSELSSGNVTFDVAALDAIWLPAFAPRLQPIDDLMTKDVQANLFPSLLKESTVNGHFVGLPAWTNAELLFYRTDLFSDAKNKAAFKAKYGYDLAAPTTWQQYNDVAEFFSKTGSKAGVYGADVKGKVETEWLATVLQAGDKNVVLDGNNVIVNDAAHKQALDYYVKLANDKVAPPGASQIDWAAAQNLFNQGKLAMTRFWAHAYTQIPKDSPVAGKVGVAPMPAGSGGVAGIPGAWYLSVPQATKQSALAKQFIKFAYDNNALGLETPLGLAATKSALESYADKPGHENLKPLLETLEAAGTQPRPANPKWQQIVDTVLVPTVQKAVAGGNTQQLLDQAKTQIEAIIK
jgi:ABC-type glycerol-3-phosphate transport system substrate-binding protein